MEFAHFAYAIDRSIDTCIFQSSLFYEHRKHSEIHIQISFNQIDKHILFGHWKCSYIVYNAIKCVCVFDDALHLAGAVE